MKMKMNNKIEKQLIFKESYLDLLKNNVHIEKYKKEKFEYDESQTLSFQSVFKPESLVNKLDPNNDFSTAISLFEAYNNLLPIQASDERFWTYLTHVDLYPYMIKRWDGIFTGKFTDAKDYLIDKHHWFIPTTSQSNLMRHSLAGLWWAVFLSIDETLNDKYELTKILFRQLDFPTRTLGTYKLGRHKEAVIGILEFIRDNEQLFKSNFESKTRYIVKYLNLIGGTKPITYFDRNFFKEELLKITESIKNVK